MLASPQLALFCHITWGAVDGIGGSVKRDVWMVTVSRQHILTNLEDFCRVARSKQHKVEVVPVTISDIEGSAEQIKFGEIFAHSTPAAGIKRKHFVSVQGSGIRCKDYIKIENFRTIKLLENLLSESLLVRNLILSERFFV